MTSKVARRLEIGTGRCWAQKHVIQRLNKCDFMLIWELCMAQREKKKRVRTGRWRRSRNKE